MHCQDLENIAWTLFFRLHRPGQKNGKKKRPTLSRLSGVCQEYVRSMLGICREYVWGMSGICRAYVGSMSGVCREYVGSMSGSMSGVCLAYVGNMSGVCREYVGSMSGVCQTSGLRFFLCKPIQNPAKKNMTTNPC